MSSRISEGPLGPRTASISSLARKKWQSPAALDRKPGYAVQRNWTAHIPSRRT